ncbi:pseudouridine synthase [Secundilactobacillus oryzae JCM 18671]|uniref:Pseudouridine synthase n=1 Tax=Secundilactobacillus oryzae JCM 18671 TaxID=1291743 RepID=A0A081BIU3_9LACO|nr:RluA family pseudouridine synthase [Secundilactobacillus oryzae]GAK47961.1 pseudouridine synthase [Secundilactobacillus oryzae JCM 18671]
MAWHFQFKLPTEFRTQPLRSLLIKEWLLPKHLVFSLKRAKRVQVNDRYLPVNFDVTSGDVVALDFEPTDFEHPNPEVIPDSAATVEILFENDDLLVVNKTRGSKTHPNQPGETGTTLNHVSAYLQTKGQQPYILNRLDQETSGALLVAKNPVVVPILTELIKTKRIRRTYLTWVHGNFDQSEGVLDAPIGRDPEDKRKRRVNGLNPQNAVTHYKVLRQIQGASLLEVQLETGRTHQIRVHLTSLGHPIVGDPLYTDDGKQRLLLHSWKLGLLLPFTYELIEVVATVPDPFDLFENQN